MENITPQPTKEDLDLPPTIEERLLLSCGKAPEAAKWSPFEIFMSLCYSAGKVAQYLKI
jgi:hypothetical protein